MFKVIKRIINPPSKFDHIILGYNLESPHQEYSTNVSKVFLKGWLLPRHDKKAEIVIEGNSISQTFPCNIQRDDVTKKILGQINPNIKCGFHIQWHHTGIFNISFVVEGGKKLIAEIQIEADINYSKKLPKTSDNVVIKNPGYCYTCDQEVEFYAKKEWFRDWYRCSSCGSIPRERALMYCIEKFYPKWKQLSIHESSPTNRGASVKLKNNCPGYQTSQYFSGFPLGEIHSTGWRNEDLEKWSQ